MYFFNSIKWNEQTGDINHKNNRKVIEIFYFIGNHEVDKNNRNETTSGSKLHKN